MRLLKCAPDDAGFELTSFDGDLAPRYAILSHTWIEGQEVIYSELLAGTGANKDGYAKLRFCSERAVADGLEYFWVDTCCIDQSNSVELSTAINSMFQWYQRADKCYVYLSDVSVPHEVRDAQAFCISWESAFRRSRWFTRGWTLQELLAPGSVEFFSVNGKLLGSRISLEQQIHDVTGIPISALRGQKLTEFSVDERMNWAAKRTTKWKEDKVYCLLGLFGVFLPLNYGEGEEYATRRLKDEIQMRQQGRGQVDLQDLPILSSLPFPRNELFVGRESQLQAIERILLSSKTHRRMTIYGLGGCGKSALALEFAYCALATHVRRVVFWVPAISQESFELAFRDIGVRLRIPGVGDDNANVKQLVREALSSENLRDWLMIVDNADDPKVLLEVDSKNPKSVRLIDYIPHSNEGLVLFTTRSRKLATELTQTHVLPLDDMGEAEARQLLICRTANKALLNEEATVNKLLETLTGLPLAIVQAAAFINQNDISCSEYLSLFQHADTKAELFRERFEQPDRYQGIDSAIAQTWHISFEQIQRQDPLAAEYLSFIACIDRISIPQSLLPPGDSLVQRTKALGTLTGYAFLTERQCTVQGSNKDRLFDMHRLVHMALIWWLEGHDRRKTWTAIAAARVEELVPYGGHERREVWTAYLPHAIHVAGPKVAIDSAKRAPLLERIGRCQESIGQYSAAEMAHREAWSLLKDTLGPEHPNTLTSMGNLAWVLDRQGRYEEAKSMNRQTLARRENVLGPEHPDTLTSMSNLASVLDKQGKYEEAESINRQTLARREKVVGPEDLDTLTSMSNLASVLSRQGKYEEAESIHRQTLARYKMVVGPEHPDTLTSTINLALVLSKQGKYNEAEMMNRQTLARDKKVLGPEHPDTLTTMGNLASVLDKQGKYEEAESINRETLARREKVLGPEHPGTLTSMNNLALVLYSQGKYEEAESINRETLGRIEKLVGPEHPDTLMSMNNLALVLDRQGKYEEAASINRETLGRMEKALGPEHPGTLTSISNLALVLDRQGKYKEAEMMNRQTLARREKVVGPEHPDTLTSMGNLASVLGSQGKYEEAESINRETLARMEKVLGPEHPETLASVYCLAHLLAKQRRISESSLLYQRAVAGYSVVLGVSHPTTQACCRHHSDLCALEEQHRLTSLDSDVGTSTRKDSRLSRGLAKLGIHRSKVA